MTFVIWALPDIVLEFRMGRSVMKRTIIAVAVTALLVVGLLAAVGIKRQRDQAARLKAEVMAMEAEKLRVQQEAEVAENLISKNKEFSVCRVYRLKFVRRQQCNHDPSVCSVPGHVGACLNGSLCNWSEASEAPPLRLLARLNYVSALEAPIHLTDGSPNVSTLWWSPAPNLRQSLGNDIEEQTTADFSLGGMNLGKEYLPRLGLAGAYEWTLTLGCREFLQVDATTPLTDGVKIDFSWRWKTTELGTAGGITDARQRGVAYLKKTANGLEVDQMEVK
jgi:hypothetical protein